MSLCAVALLTAYVSSTVVLTGWELQGTYRNPEYFYSVQIPRGLRATTSDPPAPQHGLRIELGGSQDSFLWVDGSYNAGEADSPAEILEEVLENLQRKAEIRTVLRRTTHLGGLPAASICIQYRPGNSQRVVVREQIIAFRTAKPSGIIYTIGMIVPLDDYSQQRVVLERVVRSFRIHRFPR